MQLTTQEKIQFIWNKYIEQGESAMPYLASGDTIAVTLSAALTAWDEMPADATFGDNPQAVLGAFMSYLIHDLNAVTAK